MTKNFINDIVRAENIVTYRSISRQRPKYAHATIEKYCKNFFYIVGAMPNARQRALNTYLQKQIRGAIDLLLDNGAVNRPR
jgi:predicted GTPase